MPSSLRQLVIPAYFFLCLLLGGSTRAPWPNLTLQLGAVGILVWAALSAPRFHAGRPGAQLAVIIAATLVLVLIQLIPLPPGVWAVLPGRGEIAHGFDLLGLARPWLPLSLTPYDTLASALWLLPPLAILAGILRLGAFRTLWMAIAIVIAATIGMTLGLLQVTSSDPVTSSWYPYAITNIGAPAGVFANSNHMATLLIAALPFLIAMYGAGKHPLRWHRSNSSAGSIAFLGGLTLIVIVGIVLNGSLAGLGLALVVIAASALILLKIDKRPARWGLVAVALTGALAVAAMVASPLQNNLTATGVENDYSSRYTSFANALRAAADHFPVGSGIGSFANIYPAYENPEWVDRWYVNHVHNDYIELVLETGGIGLLLMLTFLLWWLRRVIAIWREQEIDKFSRAATVASGAILLHSLVDFPLRESAISVTFAFCVALMVGTRQRPKLETAIEVEASEAKHLSIG